MTEESRANPQTTCRDKRRQVARTRRRKVQNDPAPYFRKRVHFVDSDFVQRNPHTDQRGYGKKPFTHAPLIFHLDFRHHQKFFIRWVVVVLLG